MNENILEILRIFQYLTIDFFTAFGLYSLLYLIVSIFIKKPLLHKIDEEAIQFISLIGVIYFGIWIIGTFIFYTEINPEEKADMLNRMFGKYWIGFWLQPILWFTITQLLRFKKVRKNVFLRILISIMLIISIERFMIFIISLHRDYLPSSWTMYTDLDIIYPSNYFLALLVKIIFFLLFVGIFYLIKNKSKSLFKTKTIEN